MGGQAGTACLQARQVGVQAQDSPHLGACMSTALKAFLKAAGCLEDTACTLTSLLGLVLPQGIWYAAEGLCHLCQQPCSCATSPV